MGVLGLRIIVNGSGFTVLGLGSWHEGVGEFGNKGLGFRNEELGFGVP